MIGVHRDKRDFAFKNYLVGDSSEAQISANAIIVTSTTCDEDLRTHCSPEVFR